MLVALLAAAAVALAVLTVVLDRRADEDIETVADRLLTQALPGDLTPDDCTVEEPGDGEFRRLICPDGDGDADVPGGSYRVFAGDGAERALQAEVEERGLGRLGTTYDCGTGDRPQGWLRLTPSGADTAVGSLACYVDEEGDAVLTWTWDDLGSSGTVELRGGGERGLSTLRGWWDRNADRGF